MPPFFPPQKSGSELKAATSDIYKGKESYQDTVSAWARLEQG